MPLEVDELRSRVGGEVDLMVDDVGVWILVPQAEEARIGSCTQ